MKPSSLLTAIIRWFRAGYPDQAPKHGYIALLALAPACLTDADVDAIADELMRAGKPVSADAIRAAITARLHTRPSDSDIARINARLVAPSSSSGQRRQEQGYRHRRLHRVR